MKYFLIFLLVLLASCSTQQKDPPKEVIKTEKEPLSFIDENLTRNGYLVQTQEKEISVGEVELLDFQLPVKILFKLRCSGKKEIPYFFDNGRYYAFVKESYFSKRKTFSCWAEGESLKIKVADFRLVKKTFPAEKLTVNRKRVQLNKKDKNRVWREQQFLNQNYSSSPSRPLFTSSFELPINSLVTSIYGTQRVFNNVRKSQHLGTDYRAKTGTKIRASNDGEVVVSRDLFYTGGTVTIDHGLNIFTVYGHLSKLLVKEGDFVRKGDVIALSGKSGRVTGPHLHWGVKVDGDFIEGDSLIKASQKISIDN